MSDTKVLSSETVFQSKYFQINRVTIERGGKTFVKDIEEANSIVYIIPYTANDEVYLASEYRDALEKEILDCIGGKITSGEDPLAAAKRELQEEAGMTAKIWKQIATWDTAAISKRKLFVFLATDLQKGEQHLDEDEKIEVIKLTLSDALEKVEKGEVPVGLDVAALLLFDKLKKEGKI